LIFTPPCYYILLSSFLCILVTVPQLNMINYK